MKKLQTLLALCLVIASLCAVMSANAETAEFLSIMTEAKTDWFFTTDPVDEADLQTVLAAGVNTSSAINAQPWVFTVITDQALLKELGAVADVPVGILISVDNSNEMKIVDAGLAAQNMWITAKALGYAAKIETGVARTVRNDTEQYMERLGIPDTMSARVCVLIGHADDSVDATSSASTRKAMDEVVVYVGE